MEAVQDYKEATKEQEKRFIKHPTTRLNQECREDEYEKPKTLEDYTIDELWDEYIRAGKDWDKYEAKIGAGSARRLCVLLKKERYEVGRQRQNEQSDLEQADFYFLKKYMKLLEKKDAIFVMFHDKGEHK